MWENRWFGLQATCLRAAEWAWGIDDLPVFMRFFLSQTARISDSFVRLNEWVVRGMGWESMLPKEMWKENQSSHFFHLLNNLGMNRFLIIFSIRIIRYYLFTKKRHQTCEILLKKWWELRNDDDEKVSQHLANQPDWTNHRTLRRTIILEKVKTHEKKKLIIIFYLICWCVRKYVFTLR